MSQENGINQGLTLERFEEETAIPLSPDQQLLQQARENPSAHIRELTVLAERDHSAEAGLAAIMLTSEYTKQNDERRVAYFRQKAEQCQMDADAHLALAEMLSGTAQLRHLLAALNENHAPTIQYILSHKKGYEKNGWYDLLAAAAVRWSTHPDNPDEFEREDAAGNARLWEKQPGVQDSDIYKNALKAANKEEFRRVKKELHTEAATRKAMKKAHTLKKITLLLICALGVYFCFYAFCTGETGNAWLGLLVGGASCFILFPAVTAISLPLPEKVDPESILSVRSIHTAKSLAWIAVLLNIALVAVHITLWWFGSGPIMDTLWDFLMDNNVLYPYVVYGCLVFGILIRWQTPPFAYKKEHILRRMIGCAIWGAIIYIVNSFIFSQLAVIMKDLCRRWLLAGEWWFYGALSTLYMVIFFFALMIPKKMAKKKGGK